MVNGGDCGCIVRALERLPSACARVTVAESLNRDLVRVNAWCDLWGMKLTTEPRPSTTEPRQSTTEPRPSTTEPRLSTTEPRPVRLCCVRSLRKILAKKIYVLIFITMLCFFEKLAK